MHELDLLLVGSRGRKSRAITLKTEGNGSRLSLHIWDYAPGCLNICYWPDCWIIPYIRLVPLTYAPELSGTPNLHTLPLVAFERVRNGLLAYSLEQVIEGLTTFYTWQVSRGATPLGNRTELCKVYSDIPFAIYLQPPCVPLPKLA